MKSNLHQHVIIAFMTLSGMVFITLILIFLFFPALKDVNMLSADVLNTQTELEAQYTNRKNLLQSIAEVAHIRQTTEDLKSQFISPGDELLFIQRIENIASEHSIESSIRINQTKASKNAPVVNDAFEIGLVGTYPNVLKSLRSIERLQNITLINSVQIRAGDLVEETETIISATVRGSIIFTPEGL